MNIREAKQEFLDIYNKYILRDGSTRFLDWLKRTDFFEAPASVRFHSNIEGGLCLHSVNTFHRLLAELKAEYCAEEKFSMESIAIVSLLHDVCKADYYKIEFRNVKENGAWVQKPYFTIDDKLPYGHGEKSVYIVSGFMKLTRDEAMAINWHMGGFDMRVQGGDHSLSSVFYGYRLALHLHLADVKATYLDEEAL